MAPNLRLQDQALVEERDTLRQEASKILEASAAESRGLTDEEKARDDEIAAKLLGIEDHRDRIARQREWERAEPSPDPVPNNADGPPRASLTLVERPPFANFGEQLQAMVAVAKDPGDTRAREMLEQSARYSAAVMERSVGYSAAALGAGEAVDSDGGFLVQTDFATEIMRRMNELGQVINRVRRIPISSQANGIKLPGIDETSRVDGSRWGGIQGYWVDEGTAPTATKPTIYRVPLELKKVAALGYATDELLADAAVMNTIFTEGFAEELLFKVEDAIIEGDGAGKPQGILNAAAVVSITKETGQAAVTVLHENLRNMWARLHARSRSNAVWFINQDVETALDDLAKVIGTAGVEPNYVTYTMDGVMRIKNRPVVAIEYCPTLGTVGDIILADLSQYALIDKGGIQQAQSIHVRFTTDEMAFRATYRVDGALLWKSALTPFKGTNTQSPVITLATRA